MNAWPDLLAIERRAYTNAPLQELQAVRVALSLHSWSNSLQEQARLKAVTSLIHERLRARRKRAAP